MISKSSYLAFLQCPKRFWLAAKNKVVAAGPDESAQRRLRMGQRVDHYARRQFVDGVGVPFRPNPSDMANLTQQSIADGATTLFQATFIVDDLIVKCDILTKDAQGWQLIEVKSTTSVKKEHIPDLAFQQAVLEASGVIVSKTAVLHLNRDCIAPELDTVFTLADVTEKTSALQTQVAADITTMRRLLTQPMPANRIGRHCHKPHDCPFVDHCWEGIDGLTIFDVPRLKSAKEQALWDAGVVYLRDIPAATKLTTAQRKLVERIANKAIEIDGEGISAELATLQYPLYFFDFETIDYAIPHLNGTRPYQQVPFQYSCHIMSADGSVEHREYLHTVAGDPRPALLKALLADIGEVGSIIVWYAPFERGRLRELLEAFPEHAERLNGMVDRLWDQLDLFKRHYDHYGFGKSKSLKAVLPVVVPSLSYEELGIQNGTEAQVSWERLVSEQLNVFERETIIENLLAYCKLDTYAMVALHHYLVRGDF